MDDGFVGGADWEHQMREAGAAITKRVTGVRARLSAANQALLAGTRVRLAVNEQLAGTNQLRPRAETEAAVRAALEKAQDLAVLATRARMSAEDVAATATRMRLLAEDIAELRPSAEKLAEIARVAEKEAEEAQLAEVVHLVHLEQLEFELVERTGRLVEVKREEGEAKKTEPRLVYYQVTSRGENYDEAIVRSFRPALTQAEAVINSIGMVAGAMDPRHAFCTALGCNAGSQNTDANPRAAWNNSRMPRCRMSLIRQFFPQCDPSTGAGVAGYLRDHADELFTDAVPEGGLVHLRALVQDTNENPHWLDTKLEMVRYE